MDSSAEILSINNSVKSGVTRLTLTDFRNYAHLRLNSRLAPIVITGENGSGKTNILEAISFLTPGRGMRSAKLSDIKRFTPCLVDSDYSSSDIKNTSWAVSATVCNNDDDIEIGTAVEKTSRENEDEGRSFDRRIVKIDGIKTNSQGDLGKYISTIWLTLQMDRLFLGGSQPRRTVLDRLVYAFAVEHAKRTSNFEHLYKQWYPIRGR